MTTHQKLRVVKLSMVKTYVGDITVAGVPLGKAVNLTTGVQSATGMDMVLTCVGKPMVARMTMIIKIIIGTEITEEAVEVEVHPVYLHQHLKVGTIMPIPTTGIRREEAENLKKCTPTNGND